MKALLVGIVLSALTSVAFGQVSKACHTAKASCNPYGICRACSTCSSCKFCKSGGSCSVCREPKGGEAKSTAKVNHKHK